MFNVQANTARFIYTISTEAPVKTSNAEELKNRNYARLKNGFYFRKASRSDEKVRYTETDIYSIVRTVLFIYAFECEPEDSLLEIINTGSLEYTLSDNFHQVNELNIQIAKDILDHVFGKGFALVARRVVHRCLTEYHTIWQYYPFIGKLKLPSAMDIVKMARFMNASMSVYSSTTMFILENATDHRIPLQNNIKNFRSK